MRLHSSVQWQATAQLRRKTTLVFFLFMQIQYITLLLKLLWKILHSLPGRRCQELEHYPLNQYLIV